MADIPGSIATTASISLGGKTTNTLEVAGDHDWFKVQLTAGDKITVTLTGLTLEDPYLRIRDAAGNILYENDDISSGVNRDSKVTFTVPASGTYYIDVAAWQPSQPVPDYTGTGTYELSVQAYAPPPVWSSDQAANFLVNGYWGGDDHAFNVSQGGSISVNITALTAAGQNLARQALALWSDIIGVDFREVTTGGQIVFDDDEEGAHASAIWSSTGVTSSADVNVSTQWLDRYGTGLDSYSFQTYIHEIGHALGLGHAGHYNGEASYDNDALFRNDGWPTTVMSYFSQADSTFYADQGFSSQYVVTPMLADIVAMSALYGLSTTTRTGDTTYGFNSNAGRAVFNAQSNPSVAYTLFDNGGNDTLDYSGFGAAQRINLEPESYSNIGGLTGNVTIARGTIIENAIGGSGNDELLGNSADNRLEGRGGDDVLNGRGGSDLLIGGPGNDRLIGGSGVDTVSYAGASAGVRVNLDGQARSAGSADAGIGVDDLSEIENVIGSSYADIIAGNGLANRLEGGAGNDVIDGGGGADEMVGGPGNDAFDVDSAADLVIELASQGTDHVHSTVSYVLGANVERLTLRGTTAISATGNAIANVLYGNSAANELYGLGGNDILFGGDGNDKLDGGVGNDSLRGGAGDDIYYVDSRRDVVVELAGEGNDHVYSTATHKLRANVEQLTLLGASNIGGTGNALDNQITGNSGANALYGLGGADTLVGGAGNDRLDGGIGGDKMYGGLGNDVYVVDASTDATYEYAGEGKDTVRSSVTHTLRANVENLVLTGTANIAGKGNELANAITGNAGANALYGFAGNDRLVGGAGNDQLFGGLGADILDGGPGADRLKGEEGNDVLYGRDGADILVGGPGQDRMYGGTGADKFLFADGHFGGAKPNTADVVHDFSQSDGDVLDLSWVDANVNVGGDQAFTFVGTAAFSGTAGELRFEQGSSHTFVYGDTDGDGLADFAIRVDGLVTLAPSDFLI